MAKNYQNTLYFCAECSAKIGLGYLGAHTYANNWIVKPNWITNTFNTWAPTGVGIKYVPNSTQSFLHDHSVTYKSLRGERLNNFHKSIIDSDGYMNTQKAKQYAKYHGIFWFLIIF